MAVNLIRKNNSDEITAAMDATMYYMMLGEGIFNGAYNSCKTSISNGILTVSSGIISLGGRMIEIPENNNVQLELPHYSENKTIYVKANVTIEDDDSLSTVSIYTSIEATQSVRHALTKADVYTTNLFKITYSSANSSYLVTNAIAMLDPGIAKYASSLLASGRIGNTNVTDIFKFENGSVTAVRHCTNADNAAIAEGLAYKDNGKGENINEVDSDLYMPNRGVYLCIGTELLNSVAIKNIRKSDFSVTIEEDTGNTVPIPFELRASLGSINRYALAQAIFDDGTTKKEFIVPGGVLQNGENIVIEDSSWDMKKCEIMINYVSRKVLVRFGAVKDSIKMWLRVIGIGAE